MRDIHKKKMLCVLLCITMSIGLMAGCSSEIMSFGQNSDFSKDKISTEVVKGNSHFAFDLFKQLNKEDRDKNIFISPLSISAALTMTYQGAETTTKEAMAEALGYRGIDDKVLNESYRNLLRYFEQLDKKVELNIGNSLWIRKGEKIKEDFLSTNEEVFDASVTFLDFTKEDAADNINQWISEATNKKIEKMVESPISADIVMYLINAIYFKGDWAEQFDKQYTFPTQFHTGDGSTNEVMMMSRKGEIEYGQGDGFKVVRLPYGSGNVSMYCVLPEEDTEINDFIADFNEKRWNTIKDSISEEDDVILQLPRFKMEYGIKNLNESLSALGMGDAFTGAADFSGIRAGIFINRVLHKAVIEVNEEGSEAAAATVVEMNESAVFEPLTFIADHPFVFVITDDETGTILFMGKLIK